MSDHGLNEKIERFQKMREGGATKEQFFAFAKEQDFSIDDLKAVRAAFDLSSDDVKRILEHFHTAFKTPEDVTGFLKQDLGFCQCAGAAPVLLLRDVLCLIRDRKGEQFAAKKSELDFRLGAGENRALATSYLFFLEAADLIYHGLNASDWLMARKGQQFLATLETQMEDVERLWCGETATVGSPSE